MYRQIVVDPEDRKFQLIIWRDNTQHPIRYYQLNTVTYGITTAPYLAIKCIQQLASTSAIQYPLGSFALMQNMYVDDLMTGSNSLNEAVMCQEQINTILSSAGLKLRKWCTNHTALLQNIPLEDRSPQLEVHDDNECHIKTLGLTWMPKSDEFFITTHDFNDSRVTKRQVLSDISHLFDPLGLVSPIIVTAKIFLQKLWMMKLDWDAAVPIEMHTNWNNFRMGLKGLNNIKIPRHVYSHKSPVCSELHSFSDASEKAYGAVIYVRSIYQDGTIVVRLLCSKSRVAPTKTITLPRLELCAAKLSAQLLQRVKNDLKWQEACYLWTDSQIVLAWLRSTSSLFHTFVANRVSAIQELTVKDQWRYVASKDNPADLVSRGVSPDKFQTCHLWFYGPIFLHAPQSAWPSEAENMEAALERKQPKITLATTKSSYKYLIDQIDHRNSFIRLQRVLAYVYRFIKNLQNPKQQQKSELTVEELNKSLTLIIKETQSQGFPDDKNQLLNTKYVGSQSSLSSLCPFLDEQGLIRVGGRLQESNIPYDAKHPILLPYSHFITKLIMTNYHIKNAHAGPQTLLAITRQKFWPIKGKTTARSIVQSCVRCVKSKPQLLNQFMGNLPVTRVQPARPFLNCGVDFCGPFWTHFKIRGKRPQKTYVAIFCCFSTKAVHIEVVSDLSTSSFLGALKRFISRRGCCRTIHCDNATNFIGARNQLKELEENIFGANAKQRITDFCTMKNIEFNFIPPRAPHFGGLWEAAVKSAKHLFYRSISAASLTYEELTTVMTEIEAILNSRPLTPMSSDPNDLTALTPGHFLIGEPLTSTVDPHAEPINASLPQRWKLVSCLKNEFWQRWTKEYLCELQHRYKWKSQCHNIRPGLMVLLKEDNIPVLSWPMGRVVQVIKGNDGLVRVADIKTSSGILRRPIHRLAPLPIIDNQEESTDSTDSTEQQHSSNSDSAPPVKRKKLNMGSAISLLLMTYLIMPVLGNNNINFMPFASQPGLYFESLGSVNLIPTEWNLIVYYDMTSYWNELNTINDGISQLDKICKIIEDKVACNQSISKFTTTINEIAINNQLLIPIHHREKRAPLDIIGNIASSLFGVLDSQYAEKMSGIIHDLENNNDHINELLRNQTSIIDATINIMQRNQEETEKHITEIDKYINRTMQLVHQQFHEQRARELFNTLASRLVLMITNYQRVQAILLDVLTDTHHGRVNPKLLSPNQLQEQFKLIKDNLPPSLRLPADKSNLLALYTILTIEGRVTSQQIIFRIKIPLFSYETFELLHIVPVPVLTNNTAFTIKPSTTFLIVNLLRDLYYPLSEQEMESCSTLKNAVHMCKQHHQLYRKGSTVCNCEISILSHAPTTPACTIIKSPEFPKWTQLLQTNHWLYAFQNETTLNIICQDTVKQQQISGIGIMNISSGCTINDESTTIRAHNLYSSSTRTSIIPSRNITDLLNYTTYANVPYQPKEFNHLAQNISHLRKELEILKGEEIRTGHVTHHDIHQYSIAYFSLFIILVAAVFFFAQYILAQKRQRSRTPAPPPRDFSTVAFRMPSDG